MAGKAGKISIGPFKHKVELNPEFAETTWATLEKAIEQIHARNAGSLSFEELYRSAYNMVLHKYGDKLYNNLTDTLTKYLKQVAREIEQTPGSAFLPEVKTRWLNYNKSMQMIGDILMYMDRTNRDHSPDKLQVRDLGLVLWRDHVVKYPHIQERLRQTLLELVHTEREGGDVSHDLLRNATRMLTDLSQQVYLAEFETPFLAATASFYKAEAQHLVATCDCPEYLRRAEQRLEEERRRVEAYLHGSTEEKVLRVAQQELVAQQLTKLVHMPGSGLVAMLQNDRYDDLNRMYRLLRQTGPAGLDEAKQGLIAHVRDTGRELVSDPERQKDPVAFVNRLLEEKDKYDRIVAKAFGGDKQFQNALNLAFEAFMNSNGRCPEFLSLFVDDKLRKGVKELSDAECEAILDRVMTLFRYLQEKDIFEKYYKQHLAKRLLGGRSASDDAERSFIVKLKTECGYQFTSKIEGMFADMRTSRDIMDSFRGMLESTRGSDSAPDMGGIDLSVQVLTTGSWPTPPGARCALPPVLERCCEAFRAFYLQKHAGRKLQWVFGLGSADLKSTFGSSRHELTVSTYQMCVLLLFNGADTLSYREIAQATEIGAADLKRALQSLACAKGRQVLRKEPQGKEVEEEDQFSFNDKFTSKLHKLKIGTVSAQKETDPETHETAKKVEQDRLPHIDAAVVRVMKTRKVLDHNGLILEVTKQLSQRFLPNPTIIKKRIESLIEREFLERDATDRKMYRYLA